MKADVLACVALSTDAMSGPLPALKRACRRHEAVMAVQQHLMHMIDCQLMAVLADEAREEAQAAEGRGMAADGRGGLPPAEQQLVLAVGQQVNAGWGCCKRPAWLVLAKRGAQGMLSGADLELGSGVWRWSMLAAPFSLAGMSLPARACRLSSGIARTGATQ